MARFVTLADMRNAIKLRGSYENSSDITDALLTDFINEAIAELWDILKSKRDDRLVSSFTITYLANAPTYDLSVSVDSDMNGEPTSFYELRKLEIADPSVASGWRRLRKIDLDVSHQYANLYGKRYVYRLQGGGSGGAGSADQLVLHPTPTVNETLRVWYIPSAPILVDGGASANFNSISAYEELVYQLAWRRCRDRQEQDLSSVDREIARLTARISTASDGRDVEPFYLSPYGSGGGGYNDDDEPGWGY